jgi:hypothetical protein
VREKRLKLVRKDQWPLAGLIPVLFVDKVQRKEFIVVVFVKPGAFEVH